MFTHTCYRPRKAAIGQLLQPRLLRLPCQLELELLGDDLQEVDVDAAELLLGRVVGDVGRHAHDGNHDGFAGQRTQAVVANASDDVIDREPGFPEAVAAGSPGVGKLWNDQPGVAL